MTNGIQVHSSTTDKIDIRYPIYYIMAESRQKTDKGVCICFDRHKRYLKYLVLTRSYALLVCQIAANKSAVLEKSRDRFQTDGMHAQTAR